MDHVQLQVGFLNEHRLDAWVHGINITMLTKLDPFSTETWMGLGGFTFRWTVIAVGNASNCPQFHIYGQRVGSLFLGTGRYRAYDHGEFAPTPGDNPEWLYGLLCHEAS